MDSWHAVAVASLLLVYMSGIFCCVFTVIGVQRVIVYKNSFGYIITYKCIACAGLLIILLLWTVPCCVWRFDVTHRVLNSRIGYIITMFNASVYNSNIVVSANRLVTVAIPSKLHWFSEGRTLRLLLGVFAIGLIYSAFYFPEGCSLYFSSEDILFHYPKTKCGELLALYGDFVSGITVVTVCVVMDVVSIFFLRRTRKRIANTLSIEKKKQRFRKEVIMSSQSFVNTLLFCGMLCGYHFTFKVVDVHPLVTFLTTNFLWCLVIASGGYTAVLLNSELRGALLHPSRLYNRKSACDSLQTSRTLYPRDPARGLNDTMQRW